MYILTRKGIEPSVYPDLVEATQAAVKVTDPPCWIWRLEASRLGTLKRIEVPREEIQDVQIDGIRCIRNHFQQDIREPVDGQLFFSQANGQIKVLEYRRGKEGGKELPHLGRFVREVPEPILVNSPEVAGRYLREQIYTPFEDFDQEEMWVLLLDSRCRITHQVMAYRGTVSSVHIRPAELVKEAIRLNLPTLILAHNHPSGEPEPSVEDVSLTMRVKEVAKLLDLQLLDHLVVGKATWVSLKERLAWH